MDNSNPPGQEPRPEPPDMAALAAFNPELASQALPQLYVDGRKDLALTWASALDPFKAASTRPSSASRPTLLSSMFHSSYGSLFDFALRAEDAEFIGRLSLDPKLREGIFVDRLDAVASKAAEALERNPAFSEFLFERMEPSPPKESSSSYGDSLAALADAACKHRRLDWLARLHGMRLARKEKGLEGGSLAHKHFKDPRDAAGAGALLDLGCVEEPWLAELATHFLDAPGAGAEQEMGLRLLDALHRIQRQRSQIDPGHPLYSKTYASTALRKEAHLTSPLWLGYFMERGLDPFAERVGGELTCAGSLLAQNWRDGARSAPGMGDDEAGRTARRAREDRLLPLLRAMLDKAAPGAPALALHMDLGHAGSEARGVLDGCRKVDYLGLCVAQGFYRCANLLAEAGADWKFSAKQSKGWKRFRTRFDERDAIHQEQAYFESLALKSTSVKSSARRDSRDAKSEAAPAPEPARARRI